MIVVVGLPAYAESAGGEGSAGGLAVELDPAFAGGGFATGSIAFDAGALACCDCHFI